MNLCAKTANLRNSCLTLTNNKASVSPKTPKLNSIKKRVENIENSTSSFGSYVRTPENSKFNHIVSEESPTQSYYDYCSLSQKMIIDGDRDVIWNWEKHKNSTETISEDTLNELTLKTKLIPNKNKEKKRRLNSNNSCKGLYRLQALQKEKFMNKDFEDSSDSHLIFDVKKTNSGTIVTKEFNCSRNFSCPTDSGIENTKNELNFVEELFCDEEDSILLRHSQKIETCNQGTKKMDTNSSENKKSFGKIVNRVLNLDTRTNLKTSLHDENSVALHKDDSFDDIFLSIDLSSINDNKRVQFQRHNSMPANCSKNKSTINVINHKRLARHVSSGNFSEITAKRQNVVISPISDITDASLESSESSVTCQDISLKKNERRCSKEEVEAKRLEAKRLRLLKMNKISLKH